MFSVGSICVKTAGRDAGKHCVVIEEIDDIYVIIDGQTRRKRCNKKHLEPVNRSVNIKKSASEDEVAKALKSLNIEVKRAKKKERKSEKPVKQKKRKEKPKEDKKEGKLKGSKTDKGADKDAQQSRKQDEKKSGLESSVDG